MSRDCTSPPENKTTSLPSIFAVTSANPCGGERETTQTIASGRATQSAGGPALPEDELIAAHAVPSEARTSRAIPFMSRHIPPPDWTRLVDIFLSKIDASQLG